MHAATRHELYVSQHDLARLRDLIKRFRGVAERDTDYLDALETRLDDARPVRPRDVPADVVTMNTRLRARDPQSDASHVYTVVYPEAAEPARNMISVLAPLGAALFGAHVGECVRWNTPDGERRLIVDAIEYQPEAMGHFDL